MAAYSVGGGSDNGSTSRLWNSQKFSWAHIFGVGVDRLCFDGSGSSRVARDDLEYSIIRPIDGRLIGQ